MRSNRRGIRSTAKGGLVGDISVDEIALHPMGSRWVQAPRYRPHAVRNVLGIEVGYLPLIAQRSTAKDAFHWFLLIVSLIFVEFSLMFIEYSMRFIDFFIDVYWFFIDCFNDFYWLFKDVYWFFIDFISVSLVFIDCNGPYSWPVAFRVHPNTKQCGALTLALWRRLCCRSGPFHYSSLRRIFQLKPWLPSTISLCVRSGPLH